MVGVQSYGIVSFTNATPGVGFILPGSFNVAAAAQDPANINAGLLQVNYLTSFTFPPVVTIQPVRVGVQWVAPSPGAFAPDGINIHRDVFPLPPAGAVSGVDEVERYLPVEVYQNGPLPVDGRPIPSSSRIEWENNLLNYRLMAVERNHFTVQFASYIGKVVQVQPFKMDDGSVGADSVQQGTITEILFSFMAAGDLAV